MFTKESVALPSTGGGHSLEVHPRARLAPGHSPSLPGLSAGALHKPGVEPLLYTEAADVLAAGATTMYTRATLAL